MPAPRSERDTPTTTSTTPTTPAPIGPYSPAIRAGDWVLTSGQLGVTARPDGTPALVAGGAAEQLAQALANVGSVLETEGAALTDVRKATVFLVGIDGFAAVNDVWSRVLTHRPARTTVGVAALPMGALVEVEAWAYAPRS